MVVRKRFGIYDCLNCFVKYNVYVNECQTRWNCTQFILSVNCSTCFGWFLHPSSGAQITVPTASGASQSLLLPVAIVDELRWFLHPSSGAKITVPTASGTSQSLLLPIAILEEMRLIWVCCTHHTQINL